MAPDFAPLVRKNALFLAVISAYSVELAATDSSNPLLSLLWVSLWGTIAWVIFCLVPAPISPKNNPSLKVTFLLILSAMVPLVFEPVRRFWLGNGYPLEIVVIFSLRNLCLACGACSGWNLFMRMACLISLFLMLFTAIINTHPFMMGVLGIYMVAGACWLMLVYWYELGGILVVAERFVDLEEGVPLEKSPTRLFLVLILVMAVIVGMLASGPQRAMSTLWVLLPTSGGTGEFDPFARGGVNDGDMEVKGKNANSTGMTETDQFLESPLPSLYDMVNDTFGEPFKVKDQEQSIALNPSDKNRESQETPKENLRPNREFSTQRKSPPNPGKGKDVKARALFEVEGRTPLYLRATAFDLFDGIQWNEAPFSREPVPLEKKPEGRGFQITKKQGWGYFAGSEKHRIKITHSPGSLVPTSPYLTRLKVGKVDQADFFSWAQEGILRMAHRKTPAGITVDCESSLPDPKLLELENFNPHEVVTDAYLSLPPQWKPQWTEMARNWIGERQPGWPEVSALTNHLRNHFEWDAALRGTVDRPDSLEHFFQDQRGPDYLFATTTTLLLRSLGYPARLVSGFYVSPENYDSWSGHTPVTSRDLHFWCEVRHPGGEWLIVESTPGFFVPQPDVPLGLKVQAAFFGLMSQAWEKKILVFLITFIVFGIWFWWKSIQELFWVFSVLVFPGKDEKARIRKIVQLLEKRTQWAGHPRHGNQTLQNWLYSWARQPGAEELRRFSRLAQWASYGPGNHVPPGGAQVQETCRAILSVWTTSRFRNEMKRIQGKD